MAQDYKDTLNMPKTDFPMKAGLAQREPGWLESWKEKDIYGGLQKRGEGKPRFILHDGPPFSNGRIHMGTALNKCLKDFINRYKAMTGWHVSYTPGWDNHGMPIESAIIKQQKLNRKQMSIPEFRDACHEFAQNYVDVQREQFKRLGVLGDWDKPYLTMDPKFEAEEVKVFGEMYRKGYIYKGKKPVYWCPKDETALAEAEIEYAEDPCRSIFVKFAVKDSRGELDRYEKLYFVIWTTTTWTIPGNLCICVNPALDYVIARNPENGECYILAKELQKSVEEACKLPALEVLEERKGADFELMTARHPLYERDSLLLCGDHVTLDAGTGCVHTAPGHGQEDYEICRKYNAAGKTDIPILVPVDDRGRMTAEAGKYEGLTTDEANTVIFQDLEAAGALLGWQDIVHQYAHCWRCKNPILYRATDQWFCSVDAFKEEAVAAANEVQWFPDWGKGRMEGMIRERADWCISRQRHWGLPIPVFYCEGCHKPVCTPETIEKVSEVFREKGSNAWFLLEAAELLPEGFACPHCGGKEFSKETDTLDGWFDSGSTHVASMALDSPKAWPADLYLEGGDQYRGWFQSSLLTAVATRGSAPYRQVLTHGWTVDGQGRAMHKSLGNSVAPDELIPKYGAELLRLWAASADYRLDMRCSDPIFKQLSDKYLKIRNTARYILGNLADFDPETGLLPDGELEPLDRWALSRLGALIARCRDAYDRYEFFAVTYAVHNFCVTDMSNFYLDIIKDRLYCEAKDGRLRRSAQTAIWTILDAMTRLLAPILSFTAEEIWGFLPHRASDDPESVMYNDIPQASDRWALSEEESASWETVMKLRSDVLKALELARGEKTIGKPLDAEVTIFLGDALKKEALAAFDLKTICIVSKVTLEEGTAEGLEPGANTGVQVAVKASDAPKCARCWAHDEHVGEDPDHPDLCPRCAASLFA
ncbi:MAG: isoleucine--tRNA ligase [Oscillospiraceae bacterium]|nr:isoleucine--tRNA ligase [Oscillospiraceae bacterium]